MTWQQKPHSQRYTGRGLDWAKKTITKRRARRIARYNAGMIIDAALSEGWEPEILLERFGPEGLDTIRDAMLDLGLWLRDTGSPDGEPSQYGRKPS